MNDVKVMVKKEKIFSKNLIEIIEKKYQRNDLINISRELRVGDFVKIGYKIPEGEKERLQIYEGLIIARQNKGLGKSFTLRRTVQGIGIEQIFLINSPKLSSIAKKQSSKIRKAKLYFIRTLSEKLTRAKLKN